MNRKFVLLAITIASLSSCQKADQYLSDDSVQSEYVNDVNLQHKPNADVKQCAILQISYSTDIGNDVLQFTYNSSGDPVSGTRLLGGRTGHPDYTFKYDGKNRLVEFIGPYKGNTTSEFWHKYFYDNQGNIVMDSTYIFPGIANGYPENAFSRRLTYYSYDNKRRIIKDSTVSNFGSAVVNQYVYDNNGNRVGGNYDDGVNINRSNQIWMFLNRDYSVNNNFKADGYNTSGFPSGVNQSTNEASLNFLGNVYPVAQIMYQCDAN
jgi:hypothetical protein